MVSDGGIGAPLEELLDDGLLVQRGGDVQGSVAILKWRTVFRGPFFGREVEPKGRAHKKVGFKFE